MPRIAQRPLAPLRLASWLAAIYLGACLLYIAVSGRIAAHFAASIGELETIERVKGFAFVIVMSLLLFFMAWLGLRRIASQEAEIARQREARVDADRRALSGLLASSVAHDMNNLLQATMSGTERLRAAPGLDASSREAVERSSRAIEGLAALARRLVSVGRERRPGQIAILDLGAWLESAVGFARSHPKVAHVRLTTRIEGGLTAPVNEESLEQACLNLVINAAEAAGDAGRVEVRARREDGEIVVEVHDDGPGVPEQSRKAIFEPFHTTKPDGTGLGLLSVRACVDEHHGSVEVSTSDLGGACFRIALPAAPAAR